MLEINKHVDYFKILGYEVRHKDGKNNRIKFVIDGNAVLYIDYIDSNLTFYISDLTKKDSFACKYRYKIKQEQLDEIMIKFLERDVDYFINLSELKEVV